MQQPIRTTWSIKNQKPNTKLQSINITMQLIAILAILDLAASALANLVANPEAFGLVERLFYCFTSRNLSVSRLTQKSCTNPVRHRILRGLSLMDIIVCIGLHLKLPPLYLIPSRPVAI